MSRRSVVPERSAPKTKTGEEVASESMPVTGKFTAPFLLTPQGGETRPYPETVPFHEQCCIFARLERYPAATAASALEWPPRRANRGPFFQDQCHARYPHRPPGIDARHRDRQERRGAIRREIPGCRALSPHLPRRLPADGGDREGPGRSRRIARVGAELRCGRREVQVAVQPRPAAALLAQPLP